MKVLYVTPGLGGGGGAERSLLSMARHWQGTVELHVVIFSARAELASQVIAGGATVTNLGAGPLPVVARRLRKTIHETSPDLVHSVLFDADIAARLATPRGTPLSCSLVSVNYGEDQWKAPGYSRWKVGAAQVMDALSARRVDRFHALSTETAKVMASRLHLPPALIDVIPRGRDREDVGYPSPERSARVREQLGVGNGPLLISTARHEWPKGLDVLLRAVPLIRDAIPDLTVLIGGRSGAQTASLHRLAEEAGLDPKSTFIGPRDDVPDLMCAADAFCVPSRWEGLGSIMIEAMALGAPVVASGLPPIRELDPQGRWVTFFRPEDSADLARAVLRVLGGPISAERRVTAMQLFESSYRADRIAADMTSFFERAVGGVSPS